MYKSPFENNYPSTLMFDKQFYQNITFTIYMFEYDVFKDSETRLFHRSLWENELIYGVHKMFIDNFKHLKKGIDYNIEIDIDVNEIPRYCGISVNCSFNDNIIADKISSIFHTGVNIHCYTIDYVIFENYHYARLKHHVDAINQGKVPSSSLVNNCLNYSFVCYYSEQNFMKVTTLCKKYNIGTDEKSKIGYYYKDSANEYIYVYTMVPDLIKMLKLYIDKFSACEFVKVSMW